MKIEIYFILFDEESCKKKEAYAEKKWRDSEADANCYHRRTGAAGNTEDT